MKVLAMLSLAALGSFATATGPCDMVDGIPSSVLEACCPVTCGTCGGPNCGLRPGGNKQCCNGKINKGSAPVCHGPPHALVGGFIDDVDPPCKLRFRNDEDKRVVGNRVFVDVHGTTTSEHRFDGTHSDIHQECMAICHGHPGCVAYTMEAKNFDSFAKCTFHGSETGGHQATTSADIYRRPYQRYKGLSVPNNPAYCTDPETGVTSAKRNTPDRQDTYQCERICNECDGCIGFAYAPSNNGHNCWFKSDVTDTHYRRTDKDFYLAHTKMLKHHPRDAFDYHVVPDYRAAHPESTLTDQEVGDAVHRMFNGGILLSASEPRVLLDGGIIPDDNYIPLDFVDGPDPVNCWQRTVLMVGDVIQTCLDLCGALWAREDFMRGFEHAAQQDEELAERLNAAWKGSNGLEMQLGKLKIAIDSGIKANIAEEMFGIVKDVMRAGTLIKDALVAGVENMTDLEIGLAITATIGQVAIWALPAAGQISFAIEILKAAEDVAALGTSFHEWEQECKN